MATTEVEICNIALFRVRATEIGDLETEQSVNAEKCRVLYPHARDTVLSMCAWPFSRDEKSLSLTAETSEEWEYVYDYPNDCLEALYIIPPGTTGAVSQYGVNITTVDVEHIPFEVMTGSNGSKTIVTNYENAKLAYSKKVTDVRLFDPLFQDAVAWKLAQDLAIPLGGDSGRRYREQAITEYQKLVQLAMVNNANQAWPRLRQQRPKEIQARSGSIYSRNFHGQPYWR